jgi:hypothetical protein
MALFVVRPQHQPFAGHYQSDKHWYEAKPSESRSGCRTAEDASVQHVQCDIRFKRTGDDK